MSKQAGRPAWYARCSACGWVLAAVGTGSLTLGSLVLASLTFDTPLRAAETRPAVNPPGGREDPPQSAELADLVARIDQLLEAHWQACGVEPAPVCDEATFLRRLTLDLAGRVPTPGELAGFLAAKSPDKRTEQVDSLLAGPEFPLHFGSLLEGWIQGRYAGDTEFTDYLRIGLREGKSWEQLFREMLVGPWDSDATRPATRYLEKRARDLDQLTSDSARVFFGVDITCAQCHDHPLVPDWTQDHYYGMASFFNRTTAGKGKIGEKAEGEVKFLAADGQERTAGMMFLTGTRIEDPARNEKSSGAEKQDRGDENSPAGRGSGGSDSGGSDSGGSDSGGSDSGGRGAGGRGDGTRSFSRRAELVRVALDEPSFFSRAFVNRVWQYLLGRGLVEPVDQMHGENLAEIPELLDCLAQDFVASGYDIRRLVAAITRSRGYQLSSRMPEGRDVPDPHCFAVAPLRPLSRRQLAFSLVLVTGDGGFDRAVEPRRRRAERLWGADGLERVERYLELEERSSALRTRLDPRVAEFQSSTAEALFLSNAERVQQLLQRGEGNLIDRLVRLDSHEQRVRMAVRAVWARDPEPEELRELAAWLEARCSESQQPPPDAACGQLVWSLLTSAEFRFNH